MEEGIRERLRFNTKTTEYVSYFTIGLESGNKV